MTTRSASQPRKTKSKTALRTFRISSHLISVLESESKNRGISPNALIGYLLYRFDNWDRFAERFDFFSITADVFQALLDQVTDAEIARIAETIGARVAKEAMLFWAKEATVASFIEYLGNRCRYAGYGHFEYAENDHNHTIVIKHKLGPKWSLFLQHSMDQVLRKSLGISGNYEASETSIVIRFTM